MRSFGDSDALLNEEFLAERSFPPPEHFYLGKEIAWDDRIFRFVIESVRGKELLNLGCARADLSQIQSRFWLHRALLANSPRVVGLGPSREWVAFLNRNRMEAEFGSYSDFGFERPFDVIVAENILHEIDDLTAFIECCRRNLKPNGKLVLGGPNPRYVLREHKEPSATNGNGNLAEIDPARLVQLAKQLHVTIEDAIYASRGWIGRKFASVLPSTFGCSHWAARMVL